MSTSPLTINRATIDQGVVNPDAPHVRFPGSDTPRAERLVSRRTSVENETGLSLFFSLRPRAELLSTEFTHSLVGGKKVAVRGKTSGAFQERCGTFEWTSAVKAFALIAVETAAASRGAELPIESDRASSGSDPVISLDYALGKPPRWLFDVFGTALNGKALAQRVFKRSNPDGKRCGPRSISFNPKILAPGSIKIFVDGVQLKDPNLLAQVASEVRLRMQGDPPDIGPSGEIRAVPSPQELLRRLRSFGASLGEAMEREIADTLLRSDIFGGNAQAKTVDRVLKDPRVKQILPAHNSLGAVFKSAVHGAEFFGTTSDEEAFSPLKARGALRVAVPLGFVAAQALFEDLRQRRSLTFEIQNRFVHAIELRQRIENDELTRLPDIMVLGIAPAATFLGGKKAKEYVPLMVMPGMTHRIVAPRARESRVATRGEFCFLHQEPSTSWLYFMSLQDQGQIQRKKRAILDVEPHEVPALLVNGDKDMRAVMFFPHFHLAEVAGMGRSSPISARDAELKEGILFVRRELAQERKFVRALEVAIRESWLHLRFSVAARNRVIDVMTADLEYLKFVMHASGLGPEALVVVEQGVDKAIA